MRRRRLWFWPFAVALGALIVALGALIVALGALIVVPSMRADDQREKQLKTLNSLSNRLNRYAIDDVKTPEREFLHERISELLDRARREIEDSYRFGRLAAGIDDLLDASDAIEDAFKDDPDDDDTRERAARDLERVYFDLIRGEHFAAQSGDRFAAEYVKTSKALYQQARSAYEGEEFTKARELAEAAREVVAGLESLAQAAVRIPTPPEL